MVIHQEADCVRLELNLDLPAPAAPKRAARRRAKKAAPKKRARRVAPTRVKVCDACGKEFKGYGASKYCPTCRRTINRLRNAKKDWRAWIAAKKEAAAGASK